VPSSKHPNLANSFVRTAKGLSTLLTFAHSELMTIRRKNLFAFVNRSAH
jgi:hypothetical protein